MPDSAPVLYLTFILILAIPFIAMFFLLRKRDRQETEHRTAWKEQVRMERTLREVAEDETKLKDEWYRHLLNNTSDMVLVYGLTPDGLPGHFLEVNDTACAKLGYPRERLLTLTPLDVEEPEGTGPAWGYPAGEPTTISDKQIRERETAFARVLMNQILDKKEMLLERVWVAAGGRKMPVEIRACRFDLRGKPMVMYTVQDVSERKASEQALQDSERRFQDFFERSSGGVASYDAERKLISVNPAGLKMLGIPDREEFARFSPFDNPLMPDSVRKTLARGESAQYEITLDFTDTTTQRLFVTGKQGKGVYEIMINGLGHDRDFGTKGYLVQFIDVTKRRETELALRDIERHLQQAQKMEALGTMSGGIAHDFNNMLTPIIGYAEMAIHMLPEKETLHQYMREVVKAGHRAKDLVNQILMFSRQTGPVGQPIHTTSIVKEVAKLLKAALPANIDVQVVLKTEHDVVVADPTQIHQVLMNLCTNAIHAMRETGGTLEIRLTDFVHTCRPKGEFGQLAPGRYLRLSVKDTGHGIDHAILDRIFEPFFTTKERGEGTGMGLAVVHGIVSTLKGAVTVETQVGKGCTFHVVLPTVEQVQEEAQETTEPLPKGSGRVLFVDDDEEIVKLGEEMLKTLGYEPVVAHQGVAAMRLFSLDPNRYDLVITDIIMPGFSGKDLAKEVHRLREDMPIILCTGFSETPPEEEMRALNICSLLMKPIVMRDMAEKIRLAIGQKGEKAAGST